MRDLILAIDQGTTGSTCLLIDQSTQILARSSREFPQHFPQPGWVEHEPDQIWTSVVEALAELDAVSTGGLARVRAIGLTNQRETSLIWERNSGAPIANAIVWQDRRTSDVCAKLRESGIEHEVRERTGLVLDPYFSGTKLAWTLDHVSGARTRAESGALAAGTIDTYLIWRLTAGSSHVTDPSNASRTLLWPLSSRASDGWDPDLARLFRVPLALLPEVRSCTAELGLTRSVPGLSDGIPIHGAAGDQQAALFGQTCFGVGQAKCTYGTGAFVMLNTGPTPRTSTHGLLTTIAWQIGDQVTYALEGSAFMAGAVVQWLRDGLGFIAEAREIEALAAGVPDSGGVVLVPAHAGLGAPHWRPDARGLIAGITRGTTRAHLARAALEGIALQVADLLDAMAADLGEPLRELRVDGGAAANNLLMQIQADVLNTRLIRPQQLESTALGAAFLAGLGCGMWADLPSLTHAVKHERTFEPHTDAAKNASLRSAWNRAVHLA